MSAVIDPRTTALRISPCITGIGLYLLLASHGVTALAEQTRRLQSTSFVVGGTPTTNNSSSSYSYFSYGQQPTSSSVRGCGATLIHSDVLLTSAQCQTVFSKGHNVHVGAKGGYMEFDSLDTVPVLATVSHPDFDASTLANDIMLVQLQTPTTSATPINSYGLTETISSGDTTTIIGLGDGGQGDAASYVLQHAQLDVLGFARCSNHYDTVNISTTQSTQICAGVINTAERDPCDNDTGGPLLSASGEQIGIISAYGCGAGYPGLYTRVFAYKDWIQQSICRMSADPPSDCALEPTFSPGPTTSPAPTPQATTYQPTITPQTYGIPAPPAEAPTSTVAAPTSASTLVSDCGCPMTCSDDILDRMADTFTCRARINWVLAESGLGFDEKEACVLLNSQFPSICTCDPRSCNDQVASVPTALTPTKSPSPTISPTTSPAPSFSPAPTGPVDEEKLASEMTAMIQEQQNSGQLNSGAAVSRTKSSVSALVLAIGLLISHSVL